MKKNQRGFGVVEGLLIIVIVGIIASVGWYVMKANNSIDNTNSSKADSNTSTPSDTEKSNTEKETTKTSEPSKALDPGSFGDKGDFGSFEAEGYPSVKKNDGSSISYVFFTITKTENTHILDYIKGLAGNAFVQDKAIGMGCLADGQISYFNSSDTKGTLEYKLTKEDTSAIMAATSDKPVTLSVERLRLAGGKGAPACYSHFTTFEVK